MSSEIIEGKAIVKELTKRGYKILDDGTIIGVGGNARKLYPNRSGYMQFHVNISGRQMTYMIHRLVAMAYLDNADNLPEVNHKDGDKLNNKVSNLEWCTRSHNILHGIKNGLIGVHMKGKSGSKHQRSRPVFQFDKDGNQIQEYGSIREAGRITGIGKVINDALKGRLKTAGGFIWKYKNQQPI